MSCGPRGPAGPAGPAGPNVLSFSNSTTSLDITTNSRYTFVMFNGLLENDVSFSQTNKSNAKIGDMLRISGKTETEDGIIFSFNSDFYVWGCGGERTVVSFITRMIISFIFDGEKWVNTYDNC